MTAVAQPSFTTGEFAPPLHGRVDLARYYTALKTCRNFIVRPYGGVMNRTGSRFCAEVKSSAKRVRLIDFIFSSSQTYVLEFGEQYIRFLTGGAYILDGDDPLEIATPYLEGDLSLLKYVQSVDVLTICHPDYPPQQLSRLSHTSWTFTPFANIEGPFLDINIDESKTVRSSAVTGNVTITANASIFTADMVGRLLYIEQAPDFSTPRWEVQKSITVGTTRRAGVAYYQALTSGTTGTIRPSALEGVDSDGDPGVKWQYLHSGFGIVKVTGYTSGTVITGVVQSRLPDSLTTVLQSRFIDGATAFDPNTIPADGDEYVSVSCPGHGFATGNSVTISGVEGMTSLNGTWTVTVVNSDSFKVLLYTTEVYTSGGIATKTLSTATESYKWAIEAWGGEQGYPVAVIYYQQRQVFGGTDARPQTVWMSRTAGYTNFGQSNPILDDDAIVFNLQSRRMNEIRHFVGLRDLVALTSEGAWLIRKEQGNPVPIAEFQGRGGSSNVPPVVVGQRALFVQDKGGAIRSLGYTFESDAYKADDLTTTASHLMFGKSVVEWAYQEVPFSALWIVLDDGALLGLTYLPDQDVAGWHRHDTDGLYESVCCVPEGKEDALYVVVRRQVGGQWKRYVERFETRFFTDIRDGFFVDSGLSYDGRGAGAEVTFTLTGGDTWSHEETLTFTTTTAFFSGASDVGDALVLHDADGEALRLMIIEYVSTTVVKVLASRTVPAEFRGVSRVGFDLARDTFAGLSHLEGKTVSILADGNVEAQKVVTGGAVQLEYPATVVHVGLPIEADIETLDINVQGQSLQDRVKSVRSVTLIVEKTRGLSVGPAPDHLLELSPIMSGGYDQPIEEETGTVKANIISTWSEGGRVLIRQANPLPASILAAIPEVVTGGA